MAALKHLTEQEDAGPIRMADDTLHDEIVRLEAEIEDLTGLIERSRKLSLIAKAAIVAGAIWLLASTTGLIGYDPVALISAMAAVIGGVVVFGSNTSTSRQADARIKAAETRRAALIGRIDLDPVREVTPD